MIVNPYAHADWNAIAPLLLVAGTGLLVLFLDLVTPRGSKRYVSLGTGIAGLIVAGVLGARGYGHNYAAFHGGFVLGGFSVVLRDVGTRKQAEPQFNRDASLHEEERNDAASRRYRRVFRTTPKIR